MAGNNEIREMANAARSFEDRDHWDLYVRDRDGGFDHQRYQDEDYARRQYAVFKGLVEDPESDVVFVRLVHETNPGKVPRYDDEGGAWKEEAREICKMERRFMERWTNEAEDEEAAVYVERPDAKVMEKALEVFLGEDVEEAAVYVERKNVLGEGDGRMAKVQVLVGARGGRSPVEAFRRLYPVTWDVVPQCAVWDFGVEDDEVAASFEIGQDAELAAWFQEGE